MARKEIKWFCEEMENKLKKNDYKTHWTKTWVPNLFMSLSSEVSELKKLKHKYSLGGETKVEKPLTKTDRKNIVGECADIANYAMMIADIYKTILD